MRLILAYDRTRKGKIVKHVLRIILIMAALLPWCASFAEPLGRLFFTPAQRNTLDAGNQLAKPREAALSGPRAATLNGVVTRSDGESTVWVNGHAVSRTGSAAVNASASAADPTAARVELPGTGGRVKLRVGQRFDRSTGKVRESYESASVEAVQSASDTAIQKPVDRSSRDTPAPVITPGQTPFRDGATWDDFFNDRRDRSIARDTNAANAAAFNAGSQRRTLRGSSRAGSSRAADPDNDGPTND